MDPLARFAIVLAIGLALAGCASSGSKVTRSQLDFPVLSSVAGVSNATGGDVALVGEHGVTITGDAANATVRVGFDGNVATFGTIEACLTTCAGSDYLGGTIVAGGLLASLGNVSVNARGPDHDSSIAFFDDGSPRGEYLAWRDAGSHFELSRDLDTFGNVTARHHVGTVTTIVTSSATGPSAVNVATAATEGNEATVFLRGSATLVNGAATIAFPIQFRVLVGNGPITAQVTPTSAGAPLFVSNKTNDHIDVRALTAAPATETFDYFVQATRAASEDFVTVPSS